MEPKDLKNSNEELNASQKSETDSVEKGGNLMEANQKNGAPKSKTTEDKSTQKKKKETEPAVVNKAVSEPIIKEQAENEQQIIEEPSTKVSADEESGETDVKAEEVQVEEKTKSEEQSISEESDETKSVSEDVAEEVIEETAIVDGKLEIEEQSTDQENEEAEPVSEPIIEEKTETEEQTIEEPSAKVSADEESGETDVKTEEVQVEEKTESEEQSISEESEETEPVSEKEEVVEETTIIEEENSEIAEQSTDKEPEEVESVSEEKPEKEEVLKEPVKSEEEKPEVVSEDEKALEEEQKEGEKAENETADQKKDEASKQKDEKEHQEDEKKQRIASYTDLSEVELINAFRDLLEKNDYDEIKDDVEAIKSNFFKKHRTEIEDQKKTFVEEGGSENEFVAEEDPYEQDLRNLLKQFQDLRIEFNKKLEEDKEVNLQKKYEIIEDIKSLINNKESINKTFQEFRDLQNKWRDLGPVPQAKLKDLWDTYHHHVENFYDYIKINKELRDLDLKKNMELKIELCEKAEELLMESSIIKAFNTLQKYHDQWREIGPVPRDKKEELWERFKAATSKINKKHHEFFEKRKLEQKKNLEAKTALCEKAEELAIIELSDHKQWDDKSRELIELQKVWRTIGFAPKKDNNRIYDRFRSACDKFFDRKRDFYSQNKEIQQNNLQLKTDLCIQAEALKDSTDWKKTTDEFITIQKRWKEIGPVPRKYSDTIWKRFRTACDYFFDNKSKHISSADVEQVDNLKMKKDLIKEVKKFELTGNNSEDLDKLKEFQRRFTEIGYVPFKEKDNIQNEFRDAINIHFDSLQIDEKKRNILKFKNKVSNLSQSNKGQNRMYAEREKFISKLKQLEADLALLDNNVGFFANTKNAESLIEDVNNKIENTKEKIELLKEKIRIMDDMEDNK